MCGASMLLDVGVRHYVARQFVAGARDLELTSLSRPQTPRQSAKSGGIPPLLNLGLFYFFFGKSEGDNDV